MRRLPRAVFVVLFLGIAGAGYLLVGGVGLVAIALLGCTAALLAVRFRLPAPLPRPRRPPKRPPRMVNASFPAYRRMQSMLAWSEQSPRHFDGAVRPTLARLSADRLAERRGIDLASEPERARAALGAESWQLIDPARPRSTNSSGRGVPLHQVARLVQRLEEL